MLIQVNKCSIINTILTRGSKIILDKIKFLINDKYKEPVRFVLVGVTNTAVDFIVFLMCYHLIGFNVSLSQGFGYSFGVLNSFILNKLWTFESKGTKSKTVKEFVRFLLINVVSLSISIYGINLLVENFSLHVLLSKVLVTLIAQLINYLGYKIWVFKK